MTANTNKIFKIQAKNNYTTYYRLYHRELHVDDDDVLWESCMKCTF